MKESNPEKYNTLVFVLLRNGSLNVTAKDFGCLETIRFDLTHGFRIATGTEREKKLEDAEIFNINIVLEKMSESLPEYLTRGHDGCYQFTHELIFLCLLYHYFKCNPLIVIELCDLDTLMEILRPIDYDYAGYEQDLLELFDGVGNRNSITEEQTSGAEWGFQDGVGNRNSITEEQTSGAELGFQVKPKHYPNLVERLLRETDLQVHVYENHPFMKDKEFKDTFMKEKVDRQQGATTSK